MSSDVNLTNCVRGFRERLGWTQAELARAARLSRPEISAIETGRLVPSAAAALALARAFDCSVESLFQFAAPPQEDGCRLAWPAARPPARIWTARVGGRTLAYPAESGEQGCVPHDAIWTGGALDIAPSGIESRTLVLATCDPAVGLLASELARTENIRLIAFQKSSQAALALLRSGLVHGAGVHLADAEHEEENRRAAAEAAGGSLHLIRAAEWEEGVAVRPDSSFRSLSQAVQGARHWVGREAGSGARQCQDIILAGQPTPGRTAGSHRGVAEAVRAGWARAGVCVRLLCEESGIDFLSVRSEPYDICMPAALASDYRYAALLRVLRSSRYRRLLAEMPGYRSDRTGEVCEVPAA